MAENDEIPPEVEQEFEAELDEYIEGFAAASMEAYREELDNFENSGKLP